MAIFVAKGHSQDPQTMGGVFIRWVRLLRRIRYAWRDHGKKMSAIFSLNLIAKIINLLIAEETRLNFANHVTKWHWTLPTIFLVERNARPIA